MSAVPDLKHDSPPKQKQPSPPSHSLNSQIHVLEAALQSLKGELQKKNENASQNFEKLGDFIEREVENISDQLKEMKLRSVKELDELVSRVHFIKITAKDILSETISDSTVKSPGGKAGKPDRIVKKDKSGVARKVFRHQESMLTTLLREDHWNSIRNMFESVFMLFLIMVCIFEFRNSGKFFEFALLYYAFNKVEVVIQAWLLMFTVALLSPILLFNLWKEKWISTKIYFSSYACTQAYLFYLAYFYVRTYNLPMASALIVSCEQIRFLMKMHAFVVETFRMSISDEDSEEAKLDKDIVRKGDEIFSRYFYFLWVPTLVYRNNYPHTTRINWLDTGEYFFHLCGSILFVYVIFTVYCVPQFENAGHHPGDLETLVMSILQTSLPSVMVFLLAFYGVLHCWMNLGAELTRFADRRFYTDWWNSRSYEDYYRKWNMVVGDWIYSYLFGEFKRLGLGDFNSRILTFSISAVLHEYILWLAFGFFFPVLLVMFGGIGVAFIYITRFLRGSRGWNLFVWCTLFLGNGMLMVLYSREWFAHHATPPIPSRSLFVPLSWQVMLYK